MSAAGIDPNTVITVLGTLAVAITGLMAEGMRRHAKSQKESINAVKHQVQNSHKTNLRDDLDDLRDAIQSVLSNQELTHRDLGQIRNDLATERTERLHLAGRIDGLTLGRIEGLVTATQALPLTQPPQQQPTT